MQWLQLGVDGQVPVLGKIYDMFQKIEFWALAFYCGFTDYKDGIWEKYSFLYSSTQHMAWLISWLIG